MEMCSTYGDSYWLVGIWLGTGTIYRRSDKTNDDDLSVIKELLLTKLWEQGFAAEDWGLDKTGGVDEAAIDERGGSID